MVEAYFRTNASKLIHMNEIVRATGLKKAAVAAVLAKAPWCREVDGLHLFLSAIKKSLQGHSFTEKSF